MLYLLSKILTTVNRPSAFMVFPFAWKQLRLSQTELWDPTGVSPGLEGPHWAPWGHGQRSCSAHPGWGLQWLRWWNCPHPGPLGALVWLSLLGHTPTQGKSGMDGEGQWTEVFRQPLVCLGPASPVALAVNSWTAYYIYTWVVAQSGGDTRTSKSSKFWACATGGKYQNMPLCELGQNGKVPDHSQLSQAL